MTKNEFKILVDSLDENNLTKKERHAIEMAGYMCMEYKKDFDTKPIDVVDLTHLAKVWREGFLAFAKFVIKHAEK